MARIEDEIGKIADPILRATLFDEVKKLKSEKRFGLVFEEHLPELVPVYGAKVKARSLVARRGRTFTETFKVVRVHEGMAEVEKNDGSRESIPVDELTVVRRFGEPIYPALRPFDRVRNGDTSQPHHILIEADNYHALQLLEYCYSGKVDCIYIDPPYNTGARNWKYNNDYVDGNDTWRHSKWLSMMKKRLELAMRLLKPSGILCVTIDDYEVHNLKSFISHKMKAEILGTAVIKNNPAGRSTTRGFSITHEYALFVAKSDESSIGRLERTTAQKARYKEQDESGFYEWVNFRKHGGLNAFRKARPRLFYPIYANNTDIRIPEMEWSQDAREWNVLEKPTNNEIVIWPVNPKGEEKTWKWGHETLLENLSEFTVRPSQTGEPGVYVKSRLKDEGTLPLTWWDKPTYSAQDHGTNFLEKIFGASNSFPFPKSKYAVLDCLKVAGADKQDALIVDFFAGSGTTLNSVLEMNAADNGNRQCILITNNELGEDEAKILTEQGYRPGTGEWSKHGICQSVTFPRSKYTMLGRRDDGSELEGEYLTGRMVTKEKHRTFKQLSFVEGRLLSLAQRKQLVALIDRVPQSKITADMPFFMDEEIPASVLFDIRQTEAWLEALEDQEHITDFYLVTQENRVFSSIKQQVQELLGPVLLEEEEKRPLKDGFSANLEYFKLDFLDPTEVQMGRQFAAILPVLWMMAGARGPLPDAPDPHAPWLIPADCPFAVLIQEKRFKEFQRHIERRDDLTHIFIVTNSCSTYHNLREEIEGPQVVQLYRDYLQNFKINYGKE